jgi:hypothetical protein
MHNGLFEEFYFNAPGLPPFHLGDVQVLGFAMRADRKKITDLVNLALNGTGCATNITPRYEPDSDVVMIEWLSYGSMRSEGAPCAARQNEFLIRLNVKEQGAENKLVRSFVPLLFVDEPWSLVTGREVLGNPKIPAAFSAGAGLPHTAPKTGVSTPMCQCPFPMPTYGHVAVTTAGFPSSASLSLEGKTVDAVLAEIATSSASLPTDLDRDFALAMLTAIKHRLDNFKKCYETVQFRALRSAITPRELAFWSRSRGTVTPSGQPSMLQTNAPLKVEFPAVPTPCANGPRHFAELLGLKYNLNAYDPTYGLSFSVHPLYWYWATGLAWLQAVDYEEVCCA